VRDTTRLLDAMDRVDAVYVSLVDATEQPPHLVMPMDFAVTLVNTTKPLIGPGLANRADAAAVVAMAQAVRGGNADHLRRFPLCVPFVCSISPLFFPREVVAALEVVAEAGLPLDLLSNPVMGLTSPYSLAGAVAMGHAELLAFTVMAQLARPGLPLLYQNTPSVADMRTLSSTTGGPETGLIRRLGVLLAQSIGAPACAHGHTSSTRLDLQCGEEKMLNGLLVASAGPAVLGGLGALANVTLTAYETIPLDNERYGAILRALEGTAVSPEHLAFEVIEGLATTGDALAHPHTRQFLRSGEVWQPALALRQGLVDGAPPAETSVDRSRAEVRHLLAAHSVAPLEGAVQREINDILAAHGR
jgi:trimethylamine--corrinoid protein Co-methyltransferase